GGDDGDNLIPEPIPELVLEDELPEEPQREPFSLEVDDPDEDADDAYGTTLVEDLPDVEPRSNRSGGCLPWLLLLGGLLLLAAVLFRNQPLVQSTLQERVPPEWLARVGLDGDNPSDDTDGADGADGADGTDGAASDDPDAATDGTTDAAPEDATAETPEGETPEGSEGETPEGSDTTETANGAEDDTSEPADTSDNPDTPEEESDGEGSDGATDGTTDGATDDSGDTAAAPSPDGVTASGDTTASSSNSSANDTDALLEDARRSLRPSQASRFASAIATASQIPPGDPNYQQAQTDIQRWSQVILDLAAGRAAETELQAAINAAKLVPREPADIYRQAQDNIQTWEARIETRALIREAQAIPRMGQASTYQRGILELQKVPSDQPVEHADAQRLIGEWTEKMLTIARARAAQGRYSSAIEAATLIPKNTQNYQQAQTEIKRWQDQ
ncbi:hypothetical protein IQ260_25615, partial [Leptolyngbya cf. ectocarpi LEGE 11479]